MNALRPRLARKFSRNSTSDTEMAMVVAR